MESSGFDSLVKSNLKQIINSIIQLKYTNVIWAKCFDIIKSLNKHTFVKLLLKTWDQIGILLIAKFLGQIHESWRNYSISFLYNQLFIIRSYLLCIVVVGHTQVTHSNWMFFIKWLPRLNLAAHLKVVRWFSFINLQPNFDRQWKWKFQS